MNKPKLWIMCGLSGSGKTAIPAKHKRWIGSYAH